MAPCVRHTSRARPSSLRRCSSLFSHSLVTLQGERRGKRARDATKRRYKCAQLITITVKYLSAIALFREPLQKDLFRHTPLLHELEVIVSHWTKAKKNPRQNFYLFGNSCLIADALRPNQSIYTTAKYTDLSFAYIPFQ